MKHDTRLRNRTIGLLERRHPPDYRGAIVEQLIPLLEAGGARVDLVHAEEGLHRLDVRPRWDVVVLKAGTPAALRLAAAAESWGIPCVNTSASTRLAQDKLASTALLQRAGLPIASGRLAWLPPAAGNPSAGEALARVGERKLLVKAARGSQGAGLWTAEAGELAALAATLPRGPYLLMEYLPHQGHDLKVFVAGAWIAAIDRPFPARTLAEKLGRDAQAPREVMDVARAVGDLLGLTCFGCDFVRAPDGWRLVDVNAFPGFKGPKAAPAALAAEIARVAVGCQP